MNEIWNCDYCKRTNPIEGFSCFGCGSPRIERQEDNTLEKQSLIRDYFYDGGVSIRDKDAIYAVWL